MNDKYTHKFWIKTSRGFYYEQIIWTGTLDKDELLDDLIEWCRKVYPLFDTTDARVYYGYDEVYDFNNDSMIENKLKRIQRTYK